MNWFKCCEETQEEKKLSELRRLLPYMDLNLGDTFSAYEINMMCENVVYLLTEEEEEEILSLFVNAGGPGKQFGYAIMAWMEAKRDEMSERARKAMLSL